GTAAASEGLPRRGVGCESLLPPAITGGRPPFRLANRTVLPGGGMRGNQAVRGAGPTRRGRGGPGGGGGFDSGNRTATITGTTFQNNQALGGSSGGRALGGGAVGQGSPVQMSDSTFTGNEAIGGAGVVGVPGRDGGSATGGGFATFNANANISDTQFI